MIEAQTIQGALPLPYNYCQVFGHKELNIEDIDGVIAIHPGRCNPYVAKMLCSFKNGETKEATCWNRFSDPWGPSWGKAPGITWHAWRLNLERI